MALNRKENLTTLAEMARALEDDGYEVAAGDGFLAVKIPRGDKAPALASLTIDDIRDKLVISCRVARYGDIAQERLPAFQAALLDANTRIDPFAFATLTDRDDPNLESPADWIVLLIESLPLIDLSAAELGAAMADLAKALPTSDEIMAAIA
ncbi:MAG: hypothetical protein LC114_20575 [Bryobacterales bacterium]|nr:hypothetical protein [Bryobacterales bacterium]